MSAHHRMTVSPLTGSIYVGSLNKAGTAFTNGKRDMTSDFLRCVVEKAQFHGGSFEIQGSDNTRYLVTVAKSAGEPQ